MSSTQLRMQIQSLLQQANQQPQFQISHTTFAGTKIGTLLDTYYAGNDLILNNATLLPAEDGATSVAVSGTSSFLHVADAPVSAVFQEAQDGVDLTLNYQLPRGWKFSQSFPTLPTSPDFRAPDGAPQYSYLRSADADRCVLSCLNERLSRATISSTGRNWTQFSQSSHPQWYPGRN